MGKVANWARFGRMVKVFKRYISHLNGNVEQAVVYKRLDSGTKIRNRGEYGLLNSFIYLLAICIYFLN